MTNRIVSQQVNKVNTGEDSQRALWPELVRAERTPGAVAVSPIYGMGAAGDGGSYFPSIPASDVTNSSPSPQDKAEQRARHTCADSAFITLAQCEHGHTFAKGLYCGKEWCPKCGADDSASHRRRIARVLPKAMQIRSMGYFVIEFPDSYRQLGRNGDEMDAWCYSKQDLNDTSKIVLDVLAGKRGAGGRGAKRQGGFFSRGLMRWHWYGDKATTASGKRKWNPHINVLVDAEYIEPEKLAEIKAALRAALNVPDLIVHYSFFDTPSKMYHKLKYITRSTFRDYDWNQYMARELFNFRNQRWWGSWKDDAAWGVDKVEDSDIDGLMDVNKLQACTCPDCGGELKTLYHAQDGHAVKWSRPVDGAWLPIFKAKEIAGAGYYRLPSQEWTGEHVPVPVKRHAGIQIGALLLHGRQVVNACTGEIVSARRQLKQAEHDDYWTALLNSPEIS